MELRRQPEEVSLLFLGSQAWDQGLYPLSNLASPKVLAVQPYLGDCQIPLTSGARDEPRTTYIPVKCSTRCATPPPPPAWTPYFKMQVVRLKLEMIFSSEFIRKGVVFSYCDIWYMCRGLRQLSLLFSSIFP